MIFLFAMQFQYLTFIRKIILTSLELKKEIKIVISKLDHLLSEWGHAKITSMSFNNLFPYTGNLVFFNKSDGYNFYYNLHK